VTLHVVFLQIFDVGVLLTGVSGVGKSEHDGALITVTL
jgi:serine kinase of HPr protein (carbohydrate metabolism regulator)